MQYLWQLCSWPLEEFKNIEDVCCYFYVYVKIEQVSYIRNDEKFEETRFYA